MIFTIARRELKTLFQSPLAWCILAVVQVILAFFFLTSVEYYIQLHPQLAGRADAPGIVDFIGTTLFGSGAIVLLLVSPLLTMRLVSEEQRNRTLPLLMSAPVSMTEIVLGKYLGILLFMLCIVGLVTAMPLALLAGGTLDLGKLAAAVLALTLLLASFAAVGLFMSTLTNQPTIAGISTFGLLLLWILDWAGDMHAEASGVLSYLSILRHYEALLKGLFDSSDVAYYLLLIVTCLVLSIKRLDALRLQH